jgi:hypothetical protein
MSFGGSWAWHPRAVARCGWAAKAVKSSAARPRQNLQWAVRIGVGKSCDACVSCTPLKQAADPTDVTTPPSITTAHPYTQNTRYSNFLQHTNRRLRPIREHHEGTMRASATATINGDTPDPPNEILPPLPLTPVSTDQSAQPEHLDPASPWLRCPARAAKPRPRSPPIRTSPRIVRRPQRAVGCWF